MAQLASQLEYLHALDLPYAQDFNDRILVQILLCIAAGERNLVIRVGAEGDPLSAQHRIEWVERVGAEVAWVCHTFFSLRTHRVSCSVKQSASSFLRSIFQPQVAQETRHGLSRSRRDTNTTLRQQRRSSSAPLSVMVPSLGADHFEPHVKSPLSQNTGSATRSRFQSKSREPSTLLPGRAVSNDPLPYDAPIGHEQAAQDSSAGEDLYSPIPALTGLRRPSPERRKTPQQQPQQQTATLQGELPSIPSSQSLGRRATQSGYDFVGAKVVEAGLTGLGVGGIGAKPATDLPRSRSTTTMATGRSASREAVSRRPNGPPKSPLTLFAGANHELSSAAGLSIDRRPSISSVQSGFFGAVPTTPVVPRPPSPNLPRLVRSSPSNSSPTMRSFPSRRLSTRSSFATTTVVDPHVVPKELPQVLILEHLDRTRPSVQKQILDLLRERHVTVERRQSRVSIAPQSPPAVDGASVRTRRTEMLLASAAAAESDDIDGSWILPNGFICVAIVCETDEEHDGAWGGVSRHLFDRFSLSHTIPAASFQAPFAFDAPSIHPLSSPSTAYLSPLPLANTHNDFVPPLQTYISDLISTLRHHPQLESRMLTARATAELALFTRTWVTLSRGSESMIVPSDVVAVLISVVGHRIALRAPRNEKSMFWGSNVEMLKRVKARNVESVVRDIVNKV